MIVIKCDRCGKSMGKSYNTVNFDKKYLSINSNTYITNLASCSNSLNDLERYRYNYMEEEVYCDDCINEFKAFIHGDDKYI